MPVDSAPWRRSYASQASHKNQRQAPGRRGDPCADFDQIMSTDPKQVVILGGGFAGVYTARYLEKLLRAEEASITLINRENY